MKSINQVFQEMISFFKLEVSEEQAVQFLQHNFSIPDKLTILMELFEQARREGKLDKIINASSSGDDPQALREQIKELGAPADVTSELEQTVDQYEAMQANPNAEVPPLLNYLKFALSLPWNKSTPEAVDLTAVEATLNQEQFGMDEVKDRTLDYLALRSLSRKPLPTIMCLVGAPGVGKTSVCEVIAKALDRKMTRIALGGIHSESEIRGHRRTYIGAMPGRIMESIKRAGTNNPVCVLDEIDKLATENSFHGSPAAALLEALDPEQNHAFMDHYLGLPFDLSKCIFIATANDLHKIPRALRDRMDIVQVKSYTVEEKITIAQTKIIPRLLSKLKLEEKDYPAFSDDVLRQLIDEHTFEEGLRGMTNKISILIAKHARHYLTSKVRDINGTDEEEKISFKAKNLSQYLGAAHSQLEEYKRKAKEIEPFLKESSRRRIFDAIDRYDMTKESDQERPRLRKYIDLFVNLPWGKQTNDKTNLKATQDYLAQSHYGMDKVNERILNYLALRKRSAKARATILCLVGPPGVGKTSICKAIADSMGKDFYRIALGGISHESDIRGMRQGYVGAESGRILNALRKVGSKNALISLDEIDKLGHGSTNGSPSSALLEVLDPEQNHSFTDNYLGEPFDLSNILFIATANDLNTIPHALYDRMEIIPVEGYNTEQKIAIAQRHILPKLLKQAELENALDLFSPELIRSVIRNHTMEAGVRKLTTRLNTLIARYVRELENPETAQKASHILDPNNLTISLGARASLFDPMPKEDLVGVVNGLSYSNSGGKLLQIEVVTMPGSGAIKLTGQMGDVIQESAQAALSYVRTYGEKYGVAPGRMKDLDIHIHVPSGANVPVEGPSAGAAMITACMSALSGRPIRHDYAMTGTMSLQGKVGVIGGVEQKLDGARRSGMKYAIFPQQNAGDIDELKMHGKLPDDIDIILVDHIDEVLSRVLPPAPETLKLSTSTPAVA